ncbi:hypothetical protein [Derxia lacustris]|uniref:hypothetical protein n=1 Tax=Derxia lacustris TaxID=764842 RepID=UPI001593E981|nr:hypothetical protein [Derxia lacustris]
MSVFSSSAPVTTEIDFGTSLSFSIGGRALITTGARLADSATGAGAGFSAAAAGTAALPAPPRSLSISERSRAFSLRNCSTVAASSAALAADGEPAAIAARAADISTAIGRRRSSNRRYAAAELNPDSLFILHPLANGRSKRPSIAIQMPNH